MVHASYAEQKRRILEALEAWEKFDKVVDYDDAGEHHPIRQLPINGAVTCAWDANAGQSGGWQHAPALDGYVTWLRAFRALQPDLAPMVRARIDRAIHLLTGLREDYEMLKLYRNSHSHTDLAPYIARKMKEFNDSGATFMLGGHSGHFNIARLCELESGGYSYTRYDAGDEARSAKVEYDTHGRPSYYVNAVEERQIHPAATAQHLGYLIAAEAQKMFAWKHFQKYDEAKGYIDRITEGPFLFTAQERGQRKGNCTVRAQRILVNHLVDDEVIGNAFYEFTQRDPDEVKQQLQDRLHEIAYKEEAYKKRKPVSPELQKGVWESYSSGAFGMCARYKLPFPVSAKGNISEPMHIFASALNQGLKVTIEWGYKQQGDGSWRAYAYVPGGRGSIDGLVTMLQKHTSGNDGPLRGAHSGSNSAASLTL